MGDAFRKVRSGEQLDIPAAAYNAFVDAARLVRGGQHNLDGEADPQFRQSGIIKVKNGTGADLPRFSVLGIDSPIVSPAANLQQFKNEVAVAGIAPSAASHTGKFVVLLEPLRANAIGRAVASGVTIAKVDVVHSTDPTADVEDGTTTHLSSGNLGAAFILWKEAGLGVKWAVVRLTRPGDLTRFRLVENLNYNASALARELVWNGAAYEPAAPDITVTVSPSGTDSWGPAKASWDGWARKKLDRGDFEIVHMQRFARFINFTTTTPISDGAALASVDGSWHGQNPGATVQIKFHFEPMTGCGYLTPETGIQGVAAFDEAISSPDQPVYRVIDFENNKFNFYVTDTDPCNAYATGLVEDHPVSSLVFGRGLEVTAGSCEATIDLQLTATVTPGCVQAGGTPIPVDFPFTKILIGAGIAATKTQDCELVLSSNLEVDGNQPVARISLGDGLTTRDFGDCGITVDLPEYFVADQVKTVVTNVECVAGSLVVTKEAWTFNKYGILISIV